MTQNTPLPQIRQRSAVSAATPLRAGSAARHNHAPVTSLYVHVPFCFHKCHYCDFYSITQQSPQRMERFVDLLLAEAAKWTGGPVTLRPRTVFFGGGTPTLLPIEAMSRLLAGL